MKDSKRLTIGLMIHHLDNDYSKALLKGAVSAAEETNVNLAIFPGRSLNCQLDDTKYTAYEYQYNTIYSYASAQNLDALVVSAGTVGQFVTKEEFKSFLDGYEGLPILTMENAVSGFPCIRLSGSGIKSIVNHLIKEHGKKHIAFVSGPKTNADANERLAFYREALEENGIEFNPSLVADGNFSEFCVDLVGELIDNNKGEIDAICFANDMMCKGGYKAIEQRGLVVGKDIAVTGYDDSEVATALSPMLTTIRADAAVLGSNAVKEAIRLAKGCKLDDMISLGSSIVLRQSCGCAALWNASTDKNKAIISTSSPEQLASSLLSEYISDTYSDAASAHIDRLCSFMCDVLRFSLDSNENDIKEICGSFEQLLKNGLIGLVQPDTIINLLKSIRYTAMIIADNNKDKALAIHNIIEYCFEAFSDYMLTSNREAMDDLTLTQFLINNIAKDMTVNGSDEQKSYLSIVNILYRIHMNSSYIYTYADPVVNWKYNDWKLPPRLWLKSYHDGDVLTAVKPEEQLISSPDCITNQFTPDRRRTLILFPLFLNEEHYGVIVSEIEYKFFSYIYSVAPQICTAIKLTRLINQLECSLDAATSQNNRLNRISMYDELTGVYNRRGFFEFANHILKAPENDGMHAVIIFGDVDNLKKINDTFGHEDGDYAIVSVAGFIRDSLRNTDIVGRIGGYEFAAFALCDNSCKVETIPSRIKEIAKLHNLGSDKDFNITVSVGVHEIVCSPELNIQSFLKHADSALYKDKKNKKLDILKH